jgi:spermidine synthase
LLELRKRGEAEHLIVIGGRVLMNSAAQRSEQALAQRALAGRTKGAATQRVLIGGLGMGFTLRAALDVLPRSARVIVGEIDPTIVAWCKGPLAAATNRAIEDPRVSIELGDVARLIARSRGFDAIILDLYEGPYDDAGCFSRRGLADIHRALAPNGVLAVWSEDAAPAFTKRLDRAGFTFTSHRVGRGRTHMIYCAAPRPASDSR